MSCMWVPRCTVAVSCALAPYLLSAAGNRLNMWVIRSSRVTPQTRPQMIIRDPTLETTNNTTSKRGIMRIPIIILLSVLLGAGVLYAKLEVSVEPNIVAKTGETVHLKCLLQGVKQPLDMKNLMIQWFTRGKQVAEYDNQIRIDKPGLSLSLDALKKGDATLTIQNFTAEHAGNYRCYVYYMSDNTMKQTVLSSSETLAQTDSDVELSTCETVLDKKLDKVIDWISKVEGKLAEVTRSCSSRQEKTRGN